MISNVLSPFEENAINEEKIEDKTLK